MNQQNDSSPKEVHQSLNEEPSNSLVITLHLIDRIFSTVWLVTRSVTWLGTVYIIYLAIKELAGQQTAAQFILGFFTNESSSGNSTYIWIITTVLCAVWAKIERWLRLRKVSKMSDRIKQFELALDKNRTSSGLTDAGETPSEEELP